MDITDQKIKDWGDLKLDDSTEWSLKKGWDLSYSSNAAIEKVSDIHTLWSLRSDWEELSKKFELPLLEIDLFLAGTKAFSSSSTLEVITLRKEKLIAAAPLALKGVIIPHLEILGSSILREPGGFIYQDEKSLMLLIDVLLATHIPIYLRGIYQESLTAKLLYQKLQEYDEGFYEMEQFKIPYVDTKGDWGSFMQGMSSGRRSNFRRLKRRVEERGRVEFKLVIPSIENVDHYLKEVMDVEASNWKGRMGTAIKTHPTLHIFFREYAKYMAQKGKLRLFFMQVNGESIAVQFAVEHADRLWIYKIGYDEKWGFCSPGKLLMHHVVQYCFESELDGCEFMGNNDRWLHIWASGVHDLVSYSIYPNTLKGKAARLQDKLTAKYHDAINNGKYKWQVSRKRG